MSELDLEVLKAVAKKRRDYSAFKTERDSMNFYLIGLEAKIPAALVEDYNKALEVKAVMASPEYTEFLVARDRFREAECQYLELKARMAAKVGAENV